ncbi:MAG: ABC transporter permease [Phycisphaerales bacterium]|nr:ABC transporter permease [Phycisphaerales bacterium]
MTDTPSSVKRAASPGPITRGITAVGRSVDGQLHRGASAVRYVGGIGYLAGDTAAALTQGLLLGKAKFNWTALGTQMVRVGIRSIPIVMVVQVFIGMILALQMAPTLATYGQLERVAEVVAIAVIRELGPLLTAVVLSGFAGASIAAEIGAMVESEEIKALRAHALNPIRFLVVPRVVGTTIMIVALAVIADYIGIAGGFLTGVAVLDVPPRLYLNLTQGALKTTDFATGLLKAGVFGAVIAMIACYEGLRVTGGPEGVGRATTATVVKSIVSLIGIDALFTAVFYTYGI